MQIDPNGLLAGDPLHPLASGHPFFRGNVLQGNGIDGMSVVTSRLYITSNPGGQYIGPVEAIFAPGGSNQTVSTVWDSTDLTYVLRGTIILTGASGFFGSGSEPVPDLNAYGPEPKPVQSLTIQSALPGTVLADGSVIPSPGESVVVKLLSDTTPNGSGSLAQFGSTGVNNGVWSADTSGGAGFIVGVDDAVDPTASPLVDPGAYAQLRILGIPGNQTTGQQRVPVILTSLRDDTVGVTARGVTMNNIFNSWPNQNFRTVRTEPVRRRHLVRRPDLDDAQARRRRLHLHRRQLADRLQPDRPPRRQPDRQRQHLLHDVDPDRGRRHHRQRECQRHAGRAGDRRLVWPEDWLRAGASSRRFPSRRTSSTRRWR